MKLLIAKKFVLLYESGVIVIKHWRVNNYLRNDRYTETKYVDEKATLTVDDKGIYHRSDVGIPSGIPNIGIPSIGKDRLGEDRLGKDNNISLSEKENKKEKENEVSNNLSNKADEIAKRYGIPRGELP
jgi:hypothetical protein